MTTKTKAEHIRWCKERAFLEFDYHKAKSLTQAIQYGMTSMMSDLGKHPDTSSGALQSLCAMMLVSGIQSETAFREFINGFAE